MGTQSHGVSSVAPLRTHFARRHLHRLRDVAERQPPRRASTFITWLRGVAVGTRADDKGWAGVSFSPASFARSTRVNESTSRGKAVRLPAPCVKAPAGAHVLNREV